MAVKRGLGKGLDALIPTIIEEVPAPAPTKEADGIEKYVDINKVVPNREQPRKDFDDEALASLADSISKHGVITPILVQDRDTFYEIVAGERRWRASKLAGKTEVPVVIRKFTEKEILELSLIENLQREDLNAIEEAAAYKRLMNEFNMTQEDVAERVSKSRAAIANVIRLLKLDENVQQMIIDGEISEGHGRALLAIDNKDEQHRLALKIHNDKMSVRDIEKYIKNMNKPEKPKKSVNESLKAIYNQIEEELKQSMGTKVQIIPKDDNGSGKIEIEFYSHDDFERIASLLKRDKE